MRWNDTHHLIKDPDYSTANSLKPTLYSDPT